jgi:hypothetical protein
MTTKPDMSQCFWTVAPFVTVMPILAQCGPDSSLFSINVVPKQRCFWTKRFMFSGRYTYAYAAQYPDEVNKVVLMDAFLPGIGDWKSVWLMRDLWHFHFYGETPLALVKSRERTYFEHFWNDFAADRTHSVPEADRQFYAAAYARDDGMKAGFEYCASGSPMQNRRRSTKFGACTSAKTFLKLIPEAFKQHFWRSLRISGSA